MRSISYSQEEAEALERRRSRLRISAGNFTPKKGSPVYIVKFEDGPDAGRYLMYYDPDYANGRGMTVSTVDPDKAMKFKDAMAAWEEWKRPSLVHPFRLSDGKPNRPMTAWTVSLIPYK